MDLSLYGFGGLKELFNVHPVFVHFPIALLPVTLFFYTVGIWRRRQVWLVGGRICLLLALASAAITVGTGLTAQESFPHNERIHHMMETHEVTGLMILGVTVLLAAWSFWNREQKPVAHWAFLVVLAGAVYLVLQNGDLGSRMVYVEGAAVKPAVPVVSEGGDHKHSGAHGAAEEHQH